MGSLEVWAYWATILALPLVGAAALYAARQLELSRVATSAATVFGLSEAFGSAWGRYRAAVSEEDMQFAFAEIVNLMELTCAVRKDRMLTGRSGRLLETYLGEVLDLIEQRPTAKSRLAALMTQQDTFSELHAFVAERNRRLRPPAGARPPPAAGPA